MDEEALEAAERMSSAIGALMQELAVALVASGALSRSDAAKAHLRAEITAGLADEVDGLRHSPRAGYVRPLQSSAEGRLEAKPEFHMLRRARELWLGYGQVGADPLEADPRRGRRS